MSTCALNQEENTIRSPFGRSKDTMNLKLPWIILLLRLNREVLVQVKLANQGPSK